MTAAFHIQGFGAYAPEKCLTNADLETLVNTTEDWIVSRTGIRNRHMLAEGENGSDAGCSAARRALEDAGLTPDDITYVITATCTPDYLCPSTACIISHKLGIQGAMAFDINAACSGFVYGLEIARGLILAQPEARILLVSTEALTRRINWQDRGTCVIFGDGAGAAVLGRDPNPSNATLRCARVDDVVSHADGGQAALLQVGGGSAKRYELGEAIQDEFFIQMQGREVFKHAVRSLTQISNELLERNGLTCADVDLLLPHQANLRIIEAVGDRLGFGPEKVFIDLDQYGNTSAASIPLALADARAKGAIQPGMRVLLTTFGGGFTWAAALLHF